MLKNLIFNQNSYSRWANAISLPMFYFSVILICIFVPIFHWILPVVQPGVYDSLEVRILAMTPALIFGLLVLFKKSTRAFLLEMQMIQVGWMISGIIWVSGLTDFSPFYLASSLLAITGAALGFHTRRQIFVSFFMASFILALFLTLHPRPHNLMVISFYFSAFIITATLALLKVMGHEKEFELRTALHQAMEDLKLEKAKAFAQAEQAFLGELSSTLAHEINTPLATLQASLELTKQELNTTKTPLNIIPHLDRSITQISRIQNIMENILIFSGAHFKEVETKDSATLIHLSISLIRSYAMKYNVKLEIDSLPSDVPLACTGKDYTQALFQIIKNAIEAASDHQGPRWVRIEARVNENYHEVWVKDSGPGVSNEIEDKIFQPFFTMSKKNERLGLGLSNAKNIVQKYLGEIEYKKAMVPTTFIMRMPLL